MEYRLLMENWRGFLQEQGEDDIDTYEKSYQEKVLSADEGSEDMNINCYQPPAGTDFEEIKKMMVQLKYAPEDLDFGTPEEGQCSIEFDAAIRKAQDDLGFTGDAVDGILGTNTIRKLKAKAERMAKMVLPKSFTTELVEKYTSVEVKEKITSQRSNAKTEQNKLIQLVKRKMGQSVSMGKRPDPYFAPEDPVLSEKWDVNIPLLMAFRSVEESPKKGAASFLIMMNLFHSYTKFKFLDHPVVGYKTGHSDREEVLKKLFKSGPGIDGSEKYVRKSGKTGIPHSPKRGYSHLSSESETLKVIFKLDKVAAIRATSFGRFQVHPAPSVAKRLSEDDDFLDIFINNTASKQKAEDASRMLLDGWLQSNKSFRRAVKSGNKDNNYNFSRLAAYYNGNTDGSRGNPQNYFYGQLLARQFQIAVNTFYSIIEKGQA